MKKKEKMNKELLKKNKEVKNTQKEIKEDNINITKTNISEKKSCKSVKYKKEIGNRLFQIRKILGLTKDEFAKVFNFHVMKYIRIEDGHNGLNQKDAEWISFRLFNKFKKFIPTKWLLLENNEIPKDLYTSNKEDILQYLEDNFNLEKIKKDNTSCVFMEMILLKKFSPEVNIFMVTDNKMPEYKKGDYVSYLNIDKENCHKFNGCVCVITIDMNMSILRYVYQVGNYLVLTANLGVTPIILQPNQVASIGIVLSKRFNSIEFNDLLSDVKSEDNNSENITYEQMEKLSNTKTKNKKRKILSLNEI
ncbi:hypothetical protein AB836_01020 [Rickettsiales bacterium (ex Bugula neritina AB1)]|nr:hypothetical protein AB836_01020 [Rickettsiales bacterium (ex Bugula neritina AB1)]